MGMCLQKLRAPEPGDTLDAAETGDPVMVGDNSLSRSPPCSRQLRPG